MAFLLNNFEVSFPHPTQADSDGLLALGGDLRPERLMLAYRHGIFPWFEEQGKIAWFSPDPRCVLRPDEVRVHKSMKSIFNQQKFEYTLDTCFREVMQCCADIWRKDQIGTWITENFSAAYQRLHALGFAHSVEVWQSGTLVGGLYGVCAGRVFCGESMFSFANNASKAGFITLARALADAGFWLIDCQVETPHLLSLGAKNIARAEFLETMSRNLYEKTPAGKWAFGPSGALVLEKDGLNMPL